MTFIEAIKTCFRKYITFSGRATRSEYWWFFLFGILGNIATGIFDGALFNSVVIESDVTDTSASLRAENTGPIGALFALVILVPSLAVGWRRMHDTGRSGLYLLYPIIVMVGIGSFLALFAETTTGAPGSLSGPVAVITVLAVIVLLVSPFLVLWWLTRPSQPGSNTYGPNPHEVTP